MGEADQHDQHHRVDHQPKHILEDDVLVLVTHGHLTHSRPMMLHRACVDGLDLAWDLPNTDDMKTHSKDEVVVGAWKTFFIEEDVEYKPEKGKDGIECDGIVSKDGTYKTNGTKLENTVEEE